MILGAERKTKNSRSDNNSAAEKEQITVTRDQEMQKDVLSRLRKIEGQVRGVQKMVTDCRDCGDIVIQLAAIKAAINRVGITVLGCHLAEQIDSDLRDNRDLKDSLEEFMGVFKKFS
ncbi:MAG TPA: transcriptional regulator [Desulfotomaculum sp.]|nr:transcriptional regulator [Desulfotomaculum sp.]